MRKHALQRLHIFEEGRSADLKNVFHNLDVGQQVGVARKFLASLMIAIDVRPPQEEILRTPPLLYGRVFAILPSGDKLGGNPAVPSILSNDRANQLIEGFSEGSWHWDNVLIGEKVHLGMLVT